MTEDNFNGRDKFIKQVQDSLMSVDNYRNSSVDIKKELEKIEDTLSKIHGELRDTRRLKLVELMLKYDKTPEDINYFLRKVFAF